MRSQNKPKYNVKDWLRYNGSLYCIVLRYEDVDRPGVYAYSIAPNITEHPTTDELEDKFVFERGIDRHMELIEDEEQLREDIENGIYDLDFMSW